MKRVLVVLVAVTLLAGCASKTRTALTPTPSPHEGTFTSRAFHFTISYDPAKFEALPHAIPTAQQLNLRLLLRKTFAGSGYGTDDVFVSTTYCGAPYVRSMLAEWGKSSDPSWQVWTQSNFPASDGWNAGWANLGGAQGMRYGLTKGPQRRVAYLLWSGSQAYTVEVRASANQWSAIAPTLNAVAQSFTVTK